MEKKIFIDQITKRLEEMKIPYEIENQADVTISASFKRKQEQKDSKGELIYFALLFLNQEKNTVFAFEKVMEGDVELSSIQDCSQIMVNMKDDDDSNSSIAIGFILESVAAVVAELGLTYQKTDDIRMASSENEEPIPIEKKDNNQIGATLGSTCPYCKATIKNSNKYCPKCGKDLQTVSAQSQPMANSEQNSDVYLKHQNVHSENPNKQKKKKSLIGLISIAILIMIAIIIGVVIMSREPNDKKNDSYTTISSNADTDSSKKSAIVSLGVQTSDLGNIINGQYYFATDEYVFYSSFDESDKAHIYSVKKDGTGLKPIFDGFGWSLVVIDDWLYFSGNQGAAIDGTYNIFRMKLDGSQIENINDKYSYGMLLYGEHLYYMRSSTNYQSTMSICRSSINGENEQVLIPNGLNPLIYNNKMYYYDNQGNMYRIKPDGTEPEVLLTGVVKTYVLSGEKIVYNDLNNSIYTCDLDGKNNKLIRSSNGKPLNSVNAYDGRIFFSEYDESFDYTVYGYPYTIKSCNIDGGDEKTLYSSVSYGIYINLVNNKLMLMDYVKGGTSGVMNATINVMNLDGSNQSMLDR